MNDQNTTLGDERVTCGAGMDGDCFADGCPQIRDGEPWNTGRACPMPPTGLIALREQDDRSFRTAESEGEPR